MNQGIRCTVDSRERAATSAFTIAELLVVLGLLALLVVIRASAAGQNQRASDRVVCANNLKQLASAWQAYSDDQNGNLIWNMGMGTTGPMPPGYRGYSWVSGVFTAGNPTSANNTDCTNTTYLANGANAMIAPYTKSNVVIFKCPADKSTSAFGPRVRTYSMNASLGAGGDAFNPNAKKDIMQYPGYNTTAMDTFTYTRMPGIKRPAEKFVISEEHPNVVADGSFFIDQSGAPNYASGRQMMLDVPASYHNLGGNFVFADGHYELRRWQDSRTVNATTIVTVMLNNPDLQWLQSHAWEP